MCLCVCVDAHVCARVSVALFSLLVLVFVAMRVVVLCEGVCCGVRVSVCDCVRCFFVGVCVSIPLRSSHN